LEQRQFDTGYAVFNTEFAPANDPPGRIDGLGPVFNSQSCDSCHNSRRRGRGPRGNGEAPSDLVMQLGRLSEGRVVRGNADYGFVLNVSATKGFRPEARVSIAYQTKMAKLADGSTVELREPRYQVDNLDGPRLAPDTVLMPRLPPSAMGDGLLELVPAAELERVARDEAGSGLQGHLSWLSNVSGNVPPAAAKFERAHEAAADGTASSGDHADHADSAGHAYNGGLAGRSTERGTADGAVPTGDHAENASHNSAGVEPAGRANGATRLLGRFGWQASEPTVASQVAVAFAREMGLTNPLESHDDCAPSNALCKTAPSGGTPEVEPALFDAVVNFERWHAVPVPKDPDLTSAGARLFEANGCAQCHRVALNIETGTVIRPFTDLLLHDMGQGLADRTIADAVAPSRWRTAPLWGMHAASVATQAQHYLHDGRARSLEEAILWHDGEARPARDRFAKLSAADRHALTDWIDTL
jgi:CxxC motif-containing protein (DUF1111 family)